MAVNIAGYLQEALKGQLIDLKELILPFAHSYPLQSPSFRGGR